MRTGNQRARQAVRTRIARALLLSASASLALIGCEGLGTRSGDSIVGTQIAVGKNLVGEACDLRNASILDAISTAERAANVYCGEWQHPSARIFEVDSSRALGEWLADPEWNTMLAERMSCEGEAGTVKLLETANMQVMDCRLNNGGWSYSALAALVGGRTYLADGVPAALPAIERALGVLSGTLPATEAAAPGKTSASIARLEAQLQGRLYGAGDLDTYYKLVTLGQHYNAVKDFANAEKRYREALAVHERLLGVGNPESADPLMHIALELSNQERFTEADALFARAETLLKVGLADKDNARLLSYQALHAANQGQFEDALSLSQLATETRRVLVDPSALAAPAAGSVVAQGAETHADVLTIGEERTASDADIVQSLYIEASMHERLGRPDDSEQVLNRANDALAGAFNPPPIWKPQLLSLGGEIATGRGDLARAGRERRTALGLFEQQAPSQRPTAIAHLALGRTLLDSAQTEEALTAFRQGVALARARNESLRAYQIVPYLDSLLSLDSVEPAGRGERALEVLEAAQMVRSGVTAQNIARVAARLASTEGKVGETVRALQDSEDQRTLLERQYETALLRADSPGQAERLQALSRQLVETNQQIQQLNEEVQAASPRYRQLVANGIGADQLVDALTPGEGFLQVLPSNAKTYVFFVRDDEAQAYAVPVSAQALAERVSALRGALDLTRSEGRLVEFDVREAHRLYNDLFAPIAAQLESASHLTVVSTGTLLSFPFGVFVTAPPPPISNNDYTAVEWLAKKVPISLLPSARSLVDLRQTAQPSAAPKAFVGFGDFVPFSGTQRESLPVPDECRADAARTNAYGELLTGLVALPGTALELNAIGQTFPPAMRDIRLGAAFNEGAVVAAPLDQYRIVYFATHALLPYELECQPEPSLVASLATPEPEHDGFLSTSEIVRFKLDADLVVLSACNTGGPGSESGGESLSGLARAFFFAGARALLVSHWPVEDKSTADVMTRLFNGLRQQGQSTPLASALRAAKVGLLDATRNQDSKLRSHPLFWGAFTLVGDGGRSIQQL